MVKIFKGNLLESDCEFIAHGVNCQGVMNSGIAGQIRKKWPKVYDEYMRLFDEYELVRHDLLGQVAPASICMGQLIVYNVFTQYKYGRDKNVRYVNYAAVYRGLKHVAHNVASIDFDRRSDPYGPVPIGIPWIGCGLANGEKSIILEILEMIEITHDNIPSVEFHIYEFDG